MKFQIEKESLVKILTKISSLYGEQAEIEILECLYLEIVNNSLILKATNLMCKMICNLSVENSQEGKVVINFKSFYSIIKNLSEPKLLIYIENNQLVVKTNSKKLGISIYPVDNYPDIIIDDGEKINLTAAKLNLAISKLDKTFGKDFPQNHFCFISTENNIELVSTNGNRLNHCNIKNETSKDFKILIDDKSLPILKGFIKAGAVFNFELGDRDLILYDDNNKLAVTYNRDFKFPNYDFLLNIKYLHEILVNKSELENTLKLLIANLKEERLIYIDIKNNEFVVRYKSSNFECEQVINIENNEEEEVTMKLSVDNLLEIIKNVSEKEVKINFNDKTTPLKIISEDYIGFITLCV